VSSLKYCSEDDADDDEEEEEDSSTDSRVRPMWVEATASLRDISLGLKVANNYYIIRLYWVTS